jgi:hypothetical protein
LTLKRTYLPLTLFAVRFVQGNNKFGNDLDKDLQSEHPFALTCNSAFFLLGCCACVRVR